MGFLGIDAAGIDPIYNFVSSGGDIGKTLSRIPVVGGLFPDGEVDRSALQYAQQGVDRWAQDPSYLENRQILPGEFDAYMQAVMGGQVPGQGLMAAQNATAASMAGARSAGASAQGMSAASAMRMGNRGSEQIGQSGVGAMRAAQIGDMQAARQQLAGAYMDQAGLNQNMLLAQQQNYMDMLAAKAAGDAALDAQEQQEKGAMLGGLMQAGGMALAAFSDKRLKENVIELPGKYAKLGLKSYRWKWNSAAEELGLFGEAEGVIAQEVLKEYPGAVFKTMSGFWAVDYGTLDQLVKGARHASR